MFSKMPVYLDFMEKLTFSPRTEASNFIKVVRYFLRGHPCQFWYFNSPVFIYIPLARKCPDKAITMVFIPALSVPTANVLHYSNSENIEETGKTKCCLAKAALLLMPSSPKPLGQVIWATSIPEKPESTQLTGDEPSLSIHRAAWAHHLYLHSSSIKLLRSVNYVYYPSYGPTRFYSCCPYSRGTDLLLIAIWYLNSPF